MPKRRTVTISSPYQIDLFPQNPGKTNLFSVSIGSLWAFHINRIIQMWSLYLASFTEYVFKVCLCWTINQYVVTCYVWIIFCCIDIPCFVYPFVNWWAFELFPLLVNMNNDLVIICVQAFVCLCVFSSLIYISKSLISGSYRTLGLTLWGTAQQLAAPIFLPTSSVGSL